MRIAREAVHHPDESLRCMHLQLPEFRGELHRHGHLELTWIERGQGLRWVGDSVEPFFDGDLVLVGGETAHLWATRGGPAPQGCAATVLQFPPDWGRRTGLPELAVVLPLFAQAAAGLEVQGRTRADVQALLRRLPRATALGRVALFIDVLGALTAGPGDLRALSGQGPAADARVSEPSGGTRRIDRVLNWIEAELANELTVAQAAAVAHVSPAAFARFFRREVGKSFTEYVNDARCSWAALRLTQGREPIAQVAQACGFPTLSNFGEQFRQRFGVAPRQFRAGVRGAPPPVPEAGSAPNGG
jgi:AraC-like DNA-binding protein